MFAAAFIRPGFVSCHLFVSSKYCGLQPYMLRVSTFLEPLFALVMPVFRGNFCHNPAQIQIAEKSVFRVPHVTSIALRESNVIPIILYTSKTWKLKSRVHSRNMKRDVSANHCVPPWSCRIWKTASSTRRYPNA